MLDVEVKSDAVIIRGCAPSYYFKQLALLGVRDVLGGTVSKQIELNVYVAAGNEHSAPCEPES